MTDTIYDFTHWCVWVILWLIAPSITRTQPTVRRFSLSLSLSLVALVVLSDINSANADADAGILLRYPRDARFENETFDLRAWYIRVNLPITRSERHEITGNVAIYLHLYSSPTPSVNPLRKPKNPAIFPRNGAPSLLSREKEKKKGKNYNDHREKDEFFRWLRSKAGDEYFSRLDQILNCIWRWK